MRRIVWRAPWSAVAVTEQVFTITTSAAAGSAGVAPRASRSSSKPSESAWFTRQPNVMTEYFTGRFILDLQRNDDGLVHHACTCRPEPLAVPTVIALAAAGSHRRRRRPRARDGDWRLPPRRVSDGRRDAGADPRVVVAGSARHPAA